MCSDRKPKAESSVAEPIPTADRPEGHERRFHFGHVPELQRHDGNDGDGQLPVGVHDAQLFQPARRSGGQRRRFADVERRPFAGRRQGVAHAVPLFQRDSSEFSRHFAFKGANFGGGARERYAPLWKILICFKHVLSRSIHFCSIKKLRYWLYLMKVCNRNINSSFLNRCNRNFLWTWKWFICNFCINCVNNSNLK